MWRLYDLAEKDISNFGGIYYADFNLDHAVDTWKADRTIILGVGKTFLGAQSLGFEALSVTAMNLYPDSFVELYEHIRNYRLKEAQVVQERIFKRIQEILTHDEDYIVKMKAEFNKLNLGFKVGVTRKPVSIGSLFPQYHH